MLPAKIFKTSAALLGIAFVLFLAYPACCSAVTSKDERASASLAHYMMGIFYERQGALDEAVHEYKQVVALDRNSAQAHLRLGALYVRKYEFDKAIGELTQAKDMSPDNLEPGLLLALLYTSQNEADKAALEYEEVLKKASSQDPKNIQILKSLGALYYQRRNFDAAIKTFSLALELKKDDSETLFMLGILLDESGRRNEGIEKLRQAVASNPEYSQALNSLGYIYADQGESLVEAEGMINKALAKEPDNPAYMDSLGWVYFKRNLLPQAIDKLEQASALLSDPVIFDHLGEAYLKKGDKDKARQAWNKSLELNQDQEAVREKLKALEGIVKTE